MKRNDWMKISSSSRRRLFGFAAIAALFMNVAVNATEFQVEEEGHGIKITYVPEASFDLSVVNKEVDFWLWKKGLGDADRTPMLQAPEFGGTLEGRHFMRLPHFFTMDIGTNHNELLEQLKAHLEKEFPSLEAQPPRRPNEDDDAPDQDIAKLFPSACIGGLLLSGGEGFGSNVVGLVRVLERPESPKVFVLDAEDHAFGDLEAVVQAALENREPAYLAELMSAFAKQVKRLLDENKYLTERERLALLVAIASVMQDASSAMVLGSADGTHDLGDEEASQGVSRAHDHSNFYEVSQLVRRAVDIAFLTPDRAEVSGSFRNKMACLQGNSEAVKEQWKRSRSIVRQVAGDAKTRGATPRQIARVAYRVAQWHALNAILLRELDAAYARVLSQLRFAPSNPFINAETWEKFKSECFKHLRGERVVFILPWLKLFDASFR